MSSQDPMSMTDQDFTLLKTLVALAWADGSLAEGELEWIEKVMDQLQVPTEQRQEMLKGAPPLPSEGELREALPEGEDRETFLRFLLSVSLEDGETSLEELDLLKDLSHKLGVSGDTLEEMRQSVLAP
ncbi:MAG: TerB family tellurite resistance protein [Candidatus Eremiobacteraeota bacterium]|nr:TerB family tellurite resistance protein [Candidatus Eremiobacteraeota bacterium]MCW5868162.1 TerB family tellurite resistance protein [Candidatus Eremiobacteraeota bacterium]